MNQYLKKNISIIIPTLNSGNTLIDTMESVKSVEEIIIVDGGSIDKTIKIARTKNAKLIHSSRGRGIQLSRGAKASKKEWLLFIHSDTKLEKGWESAVEKFIKENKNIKAGWFFLNFSNSNKRLKIIAKFANLRAKYLAIPYGDQGLLISKDLYLTLGGYSKIPIMEDVEFILRLGRKRIGAIKANIYTSPKRYIEQGYMLRSIQNIICLSFFLLGFPIQKIYKLYEKKF